jgi:hypothetical protein
VDADDTSSLRQPAAHDLLLPLRRLARRLGPAGRPPVSDERHNERVLYTEMFFQAFAGAGALSFASVFLVRLGAPTFLVGLFSSMPALVVILTVLPTGAWVQQQKDLVKVANWSRLMFRVAIASFGLLVYLPPGLAPYLMVGAESLMSIPSSALNVAHATILGQATSPRRRPAMLSTRMAVHGLTAAGVGFLAGQWLDWAPYPLNYQLLFLSALVAGLGSIATLAQVRMLRPRVEGAHAAGARTGISRMLALVNSVPAFKRYAITSFVFRAGLHLPMALFSIYRVRTLGASDAWIGVLFTVERLISVVVYVVLSRILTHPRVRDRLWISCLGSSLYPLATALARTPEELLLASAVAGLFGPGMELFMTNTLFQVSPEDDRPTFVAANSFLANLSAFGAPLLGTLLADVVDIRFALVVGTLVRLVGSASFWRFGVGRADRSRDDPA